jgi:hypothetical protein
MENKYNQHQESNHGSPKIPRKKSEKNTKKNTPGSKKDSTFLTCCNGFPARTSRSSRKESGGESEANSR